MQEVVKRMAIEPEPARVEDAPALARLIVMAGHGMPLLVWEEMRAPDEDVWDVGARRAAREEGGFSYRNARVIRQEGAVIAALVGYPLQEVVSAADLDDLPAMFQPLVALENRAVPSWYVNVLATFPEARGQGAARVLLAEAEMQARAAGLERMSIITNDDNPARRLYERVEYAEVSRLPVVAGAWETQSTEWVLLMKPL